jgi:ribosome-binding factor A
MSAFKKEHILEELRARVSDFFARESNATSLVTVTRIDLSEDLKTATINLSVFPENKQHEVRHFAIRHLTEIRSYLQKNSKIGRVPFLKIEIDKGEALLERMNELL